MPRSPPSTSSAIGVGGESAERDVAALILAIATVIMFTLTAILVAILFTPAAAVHVPVILFLTTMAAEHVALSATGTFILAGVLAFLTGKEVSSC